MDGLSARVARCDRALRVVSGEPRRLQGADDTRELIFSRERQIKGALARCGNRRSREMWRGESAGFEINEGHVTRCGGQTNDAASPARPGGRAAASIVGMPVVGRRNPTSGGPYKRAHNN